VAISYTTFIWKVICLLIKNYSAAMLLIHHTKQEFLKNLLLREFLKNLPHIVIYR